MRATLLSRVRFEPRKIKADFYRGGTSRGLLFTDKALAPFAQAQRDEIICSLMGSPDPDGRQIDGFGGGASSLSKCAIVHYRNSDSARLAREHGIPFPGLDWIGTERDELLKEGRYDVVYRFGQVAIKERSVDWGSTCGNLVAAVAHFAISHRLYSLQTLDNSSLPLFGSTQGVTRSELKQKYVSGEEKAVINLPILAHDTGKIVIARVPVEPSGYHLNFWRSFDEKHHAWIPLQRGDAQIAGVPGTAPGILIESPLGDGPEGSSANSGILSTGRQRDSVEVDGQSIDVTIVDTGLPVVFVAADSLGVSLDTLRRTPAELDADRTLMDKLERVRHAASQLTPALAAKFSPPAPKLCIVHAAADYTTTGGVHVEAKSMDLLARIVSVGQLHRTIPATTLSALAAARCFRDSVVCQTIAQSQAGRETGHVVPSTHATMQDIIATGAADKARIQAVTVGQPAGLSMASVLTDGQEANPTPISTVMLRTARKIMSGESQVPFDVPYSKDCQRAIESANKPEGTETAEETKNKSKASTRRKRKAVGKKSNLETAGKSEKVDNGTS